MTDDASMRFKRGDHIAALSATGKDAIIKVVEAYSNGYVVQHADGTRCCTGAGIVDTCVLVDRKGIDDGE